MCIYAYTIAIDKRKRLKPGSGLAESAGSGRQRPHGGNKNERTYDGDG